MNQPQGRTTFTTVIVGARTGVRKFAISAAVGDGLTRAERNRLSDFGNALAAWSDTAADRGVTEFVAAFPLAPGGRWLLARARLVALAGGEPEARAGGLLLEPEHVGDSHRLLALAPSPSDDPRALRETEIETPYPPAPAAPEYEPEVRFLSHHLANQRLVLEADPADGAEALLNFVLDGAPGPVGGWCTTGSLEANGGFDPDALFDLIVHTPGDHPGRPAAGRRQAKIRGLKVIWSNLEPSAAQIVWSALARDEDDRSLLSPWLRNLGAGRPDDFAPHLFSRRFDELPDKQFATVLFKWAHYSAGIEPEALKQTVQVELVEAYMARLPAKKPDEAAQWLDLYVDRFLPPLGEALPRRAAREILDRGLLHLMTGKTLRALARRGLLIGMAARTVTALTGGPLLTDAGLTGMLQGLCDVLSPGETPGPDLVMAAQRLIEPAAWRVAEGAGDGLKTAFELAVLQLVRQLGLEALGPIRTAVGKAVFRPALDGEGDTARVIRRIVLEELRTRGPALSTAVALGLEAIGEQTGSTVGAQNHD